MIDVIAVRVVWLGIGVGFGPYLGDGAYLVSAALAAVAIVLILADARRRR